MDNKETSQMKIITKNQINRRSVCAICKKKLSILDFGCRCGNLYCSVHRLPHNIIVVLIMKKWVKIY